MGLTYSCIHVYTENPVSVFSDFRSFSPGWQTLMRPYNPGNPTEFPQLAKKISKKTDTPVLWVYLFDDECLAFEIYQNGKMAAAFNPTFSKNLYSIPRLIGYEQGTKRRLSTILACGDIDTQMQLLEEYFGVCLISLPEDWEKPETLLRVRSDALYQAYLAEEKKLMGKKAPLKAQLVSQQPGKLFFNRFSDKNKNSIRRYHYYYGYDSPDSPLTGEQLQPVRFEQGTLMPISQAQFDAAERTAGNNPECFSEQYYPVEKIYFNEKAPGELKNKTLICPREYHFFCFDQNGRILLTNFRSSIAVADATLKIIAKLQVKGIPCDFKDGYILTTGSSSFWLYGYSPAETIRIYRIFDSSENSQCNA